jgi:hypothetical protein
MSKTFLDDNLLTWEAYASGGAFEAAEHPFIVFNCLSNRMLRPRFISGGDEANAAGKLAAASSAQLRDMFKRSDEVS